MYSNQDPDYIPDAESIHVYPYPTDFRNAPNNCVYQYFKLLAQQWRRELVKIWGPMIGSQIKLSISEWQAGMLSWSGWRTPSTVQAFYAGWFRYVLQGQALADGSVGATERWWSAILFDAATDKDDYDFIKADGTLADVYNAAPLDVDHVANLAERYLGVTVPA